MLEIFKSVIISGGYWRVLIIRKWCHTEKVISSIIIRFISNTSSMPFKQKQLYAYIGLYRNLEIPFRKSLRQFVYRSLKCLCCAISTSSLLGILQKSFCICQEEFAREILTVDSFKECSHILRNSLCSKSPKVFLRPCRGSTSNIIWLHVVSLHYESKKRLDPRRERRIYERRRSCEIARDIKDRRTFRMFHKRFCSVSRFSSRGE